MCSPGALHIKHNPVCVLPLKGNSFIAELTPRAYPPR